MSKRLTAREIVMVVVIIVLGGLNIYQYFNRPAAPVVLQTRPRLSPAEQGIVEQFHKIFYDSNVWQSTRWLGILTQQNPNDVWIHQEIITEVKPDFIVEAGTLNGGSAALWATILQQVNPEGRVITIDIADNAGEARKLPIVQQKVDFLIGSSTDPAIVDQVTKRVQGRKVLVILDSDHSKDQVLAEMKAYAPLVPVGSYLIVQDTNINGHPVLESFGPGPWEAVEEFLSTNDQFKPDPECERLLFTMHPYGYLKRIK